MLSTEAKNLLNHFIEIYKKTGSNRFEIEHCLGIPNVRTSIDELKAAGVLNEANNVLQTLSINFDAIDD